METITGEEFLGLLRLEEDIKIVNYNVQIDYNLIINIKDIVYKNVITNCRFNNRIEIIDTEIDENNKKYYEFEFVECVFQEIVFQNLNLQNIILEKIEVENDVIFNNCKVFSLVYNKVISHRGSIIFKENFFKNIDINELEVKKGSLTLLNNSTEYNINYKVNISASDLSHVKIEQNNFRNKFSFTYNTLFHNLKENTFNNNIFSETNFSYTDFGSLTQFNNSTFNAITLFENIKNIKFTQLGFLRCTFKDTVSFNKSNIFNLFINVIVFEKQVFFQECEYDEIFIDRTIFEKPVFFDDIKINNVLECSRSTLRTIKQQLQKVENRIDYNRFRVFEFSVYKHELKREIKILKKQLPLYDRIFDKHRQYATAKRDLFVLKLSHVVSDYGTDWKKALKFTLLLGFTLYIPFFVLENYTKDWDISNWQVAPIGCLRFFILTDFYSPLKDGRTYIDMDGWNHLVSWFIFILGKIFIAFGIYEMIQAFRKFKA